jgi:Tol biopolymer transport system component
VPTPKARIDVRWEDARFDFFTGAQQAMPYAGQFPDVAPEDFKWSLYSNAIGGPALQLYETGNWLRGPSWSADGGHISAFFLAQAADPGNMPSMVAGVLSFDAAKPTQTPAQLALQNPTFLDPLDGGEKALYAAFSMPAPPAPGAPPVFDPAPLLQVDVAKQTARRLTGLPGRQSPVSGGAWSPDGVYVVVHVSYGPGTVINNIITPPTGSTYVVPATGGAAQLITNGYTTWQSWSPTKPYRIAYVQERALWLFDLPSGRSRRLTADGTLPEGYSLTWTADGRYIQVHNRLIDTRNGDVTTYTFPGLKTMTTVAISPDRRYAVTSEFPLPSGDTDSAPCPATERPQNKVYLLDKQKNATRVVKDCDGRAFIQFTWMADNRHVVMEGYGCAACEDPHRNIVLLDVQTGVETPLTHGLEFSAWATLSPDGQKILVTGDSARVYGQDGKLLQQAAPPAGFSVTDAAWAPDNRRFTYVVGPTGVWSL